MAVNLQYGTSSMGGYFAPDEVQHDFVARLDPASADDGAVALEVETLYHARLSRRHAPMCRFKLQEKAVGA